MKGLIRSAKVEPCPDGSFLGQPRLQDIGVPSSVVPNVRHEREDLGARAIDVLLSTVIMPFSLLASYGVVVANDVTSRASRERPAGELARHLHQGVGAVP